jgi:hypothetical protein
MNRMFCRSTNLNDELRRDDNRLEQLVIRG